MKRFDLKARISETLATRGRDGLARALRPMASLPNARVRIGDRVLVNFSSNDYLGLSRHPAVVERARAWAADFGAGAGASRLVCGTSPAHEAVEARIAAAKGTEAALVMGSGFQANTAVLAALLHPDLHDAPPLVFADRLNHASLHAGCALAGVRQIRFRHNDLGNLETLLLRHADTPGSRLIITESVFSMDGDRADLAALSDLARRHGAFVYVDDAHATGVLGPNGYGLADPDTADLILGTFSKGLGGQGAYVACSRAVRDWLVNRAGGFIYSTAPPPAVLGAMDAAWELVPKLGAERGRLEVLSHRLRAALAARGFDTGGSASQIVPAIVGGSEAAVDLASGLERAGYLGVAIRPPTVPKGTARVRLTLSAAHGDADLDGLIAAMTEVAAA